MGVNKKIIPLVSLIILVFTVFCGCAKNNLSENTTDNIAMNTPEMTISATINTGDHSATPYDIPERETWNIDMVISNIKYAKDKLGHTGFTYTVEIFDRDNIGFYYISQEEGLDYYNGKEWIEIVPYFSTIVPPTRFGILPQIPPKCAFYRCNTGVYLSDEELPDGKYRHYVKVYDKVNEKIIYGEFEIVKGDLLKAYYENNGK